MNKGKINQYLSVLLWHRPFRAIHSQYFHYETADWYSVRTLCRWTKTHRFVCDKDYGRWLVSSCELKGTIIQYNKNLFIHGRIIQYYNFFKKKIITDLHNCRVGVIIVIDKHNNRL